MERENILEHETRQVPTRDDIVEHRQFAAPLTLELVGRGLLVVAIEL